MKNQANTTEEEVIKTGQDRIAQIKSEIATDSTSNVSKAEVYETWDNIFNSE